MVASSQLPHNTTMGGYRAKDMSAQNVVAWDNRLDLVYSHLRGIGTRSLP